MRLTKEIETGETDRTVLACASDIHPGALSAEELKGVVRPWAYVIAS